MTNVPSNGPTLTEIARRLQRVEDKQDAQLVTREMLAASEKLYEAREIAHAAAVQALESRVTKLEGANSRLTFMLIAAFLGMLISVITQVLSATGGGS